MKKIIILNTFLVIGIASQAQLLKKIKARIEQSAKDVKNKIVNKAEKAPERIIDHTAIKVQTKAEGKIENAQTKINNNLDRTVDKVDSIKIKKPAIKVRVTDSLSIPVSDTSKAVVQNKNLKKTSGYLNYT